MNSITTVTRVVHGVFYLEVFRKIKMKDFTEDIEKAVDALLKISDDPSRKKELLEKNRIVYLQVLLFQIPFGAPRKKKFLKIQHSLYGESPEICLFVPNRSSGVKYKKTSDELIDFCVNYYTELLEKHKVKGIATIMPLKQLKSEYGSYDLRRKLVRRFDLFLCKNSLLYNSRFLTSLGRIFRVANKEPLGISFPNKDVNYDPEFQKNINRAILTSTFLITSFSDNYSIPFGTLSHTKVELKENLQLVLDQLFTEEIIPGGMKNVRAMNLWLSQSKSIPFFVNTELPVDMRRPRLKSKKRRKTRGVEGEISTQPNKKVFVMQNGEVFVTKKRKTSPEPENFDSELSARTLQVVNIYGGHQKLNQVAGVSVTDNKTLSIKDEESFDDVSDDEEMKEEKKEEFKTKDKKTKTEEESESESDEEIEKKEARLMKGKMLNEESFYPQSQAPQKAGQKKEKKILSKKVKAKRQNGDNQKFNKKARTITKKSKEPVNNKSNVIGAKKKPSMKQKKLNFSKKADVKKKSKNKKV